MFVCDKNNVYISVIYNLTILKAVKTRLFYNIFVKCNLFYNSLFTATINIITTVHGTIFLQLNIIGIHCYTHRPIN
jgi:hypothetical protein